MPLVRQAVSVNAQGASYLCGLPSPRGRVAAGRDRGRESLPCVDSRDRCKNVARLKRSSCVRTQARAVRCCNRTAAELLENIRE